MDEMCMRSFDFGWNYVWRAAFEFYFKDSAIEFYFKDTCVLQFMLAYITVFADLMHS